MDLRIILVHLLGNLIPVRLLGRPVLFPWRCCRTLQEHYYAWSYLVLYEAGLVLEVLVVR